MENYNPNATYKFTDKNGNTFTSKGNNGYVWQSITEGTPISINSAGEWYIEPYIEAKDNNVTVHMPEWFTSTDEYAEWKDKYAYLLDSMELSDSNLSQMNDVLRGYGSQGAFRVMSKNEISKLGVTDEGIKNKYFNDLLQIQAEANNVRDAQITDVFGSDKTESAAEIARSFQERSKEDLSRLITKMSYIANGLSKKENPTWEEQKNAADALTTLKLLNMVDDNYSMFGDGEEFKGLLEASGLQKFFSMVDTHNDVANQGIVAVPGRFLYGMLNLFAGKGFDANLTSGVDLSTDPYAGASLEGTEGWKQAGMVTGNIENIVTVIAVSMGLGGVVSSLGAKMASGALGLGGITGSAISALGSFMQTVPGGMVTDFVLHDTPIDLLQFFTDASTYNWDFSKAWDNPDAQQNLIAVPVIGDIASSQFGTVNAGLKNNLIGDAIVDLSIPIMSILGKSVSTKLNAATNGTYQRVKDKIALKNMEIQNNIADMPVFGDAWKRFINHMSTPENASFIRVARRRAVELQSLDIYRDAHNYLTLKNHYGSEAVAPLYEAILTKYDIPDTVKMFQKNAAKYGGIGEVSVEWKEIKGDKTINKFKTVLDVLPKDVKQGLLDIERLGELKGADSGGLFSTNNEKEIAKLEKRVEALPKEIKDFADKMIAANKDLEQVGVLLGVSNKEWVDALQADERWSSYMTRQAVTVGYGMDGVTGSKEPLKAKQLTSSRKGYYSDKYIDPFISLNMKAVALGRAYAWNEQAKFVVGMQASSGGLIAGKHGVDVAKRLEEVRSEIKTKTEYRALIKYDETIARISSDNDVISNTFREINDTLDAPRKLSIKSVYTERPKNITELVDNFESGNIRFADGIREDARLTDDAAASIIRNTYEYDGDGSVGKTTVKTEIAKVDSPEVPTQSKGTDAPLKTEAPEAPTTTEAPKTIQPEQPVQPTQPAQPNRPTAQKLQDQSDPETFSGTVYHGSGKTRSETYSGAQVPVMGDGKYWAFSENGAKNFGNKVESEDVKLNNVLVITTEDQWRSLTKQAGWKYPNPFGVDEATVKTNAESLKKLVTDAGYDGIIIRVGDSKLLNNVFSMDQLVVYKQQSANIDLPRISQQIQDLTRQAERTIQDNLEGGYYFDSDAEPLVKRGLLTKEDDNGEIYYYVKDNPTLDELEEIYNWQKKMSEDWDRDDFTEVNFEEIRSLNPNQPNLNGEFMAAEQQISEQKTSGKINTGYGMTDAGVPYKYEIEDGVITKLDLVTDYEKLSESVNKITGTYRLPTATASKMGNENIYAINRTVLFYRNNFPVLNNNSTFFLEYNRGAYGWCPTQYVVKYVDGKIVIDDFPIYLNSDNFSIGKEADTKNSLRRSVNSGFSPKNAYDLSSTPIHENGHSTTWKLSMNEINRKLENKELINVAGRTYNTLEGLSSGELTNFFYYYRTQMQEEIIKTAMNKMGIEFDGRHINVNKQRATISGYANDISLRYATKNSETIAEAFSDYAANGQNASKFTLAIMEEFNLRMSKFSNASSPFAVMHENGLEMPKKLIDKDSGQYAFPKSVVSGDDKAKWLDTWRNNNPYLKGEMDEKTFQKANLWDTYFDNEIKSYSGKFTTSAPELLIEKNAKFLENYSKDAAKRLTDKIKSLSVEGFDSNIATLALSHNANDTARALEEFVISRVNASAKKIAERMEGGLTEDNLAKARLTLWGDSTVQNSFCNMVQTLVPDMSSGNVAKQMGELFETQLKGMAAYEALPVETKQLLSLEKNLLEKLHKENKYAKSVGKKIDQGLTDYRGDVTQVIRYRQGGEDVYVVVNDPVIANILKNPNNYKETGVVAETAAQISNFISRAYRLGTTGTNPIAFVNNVLRDPIQAVFQGGWNPLNMVLSPEAYYRSLRQYGLDDKTISTVMDRIYQQAKRGTLTEEIKSLGGATPGTVGYRSKTEKISKKVNSALMDNKFIEVAEAPLNAWERTFRNQIGLQSFEKNYKRTKDVNKAMAAALFDTSNSTTNFSHSVGIFKRATSTVPYLSSAINGTASFWRMFNVDPVGMTLRISNGLMLPALALTAWNLSSEERRNSYMNIPEWYRQGHIVMVDGEGSVYAFPLPEEIQQFYGTARKIMEYTNDATPYAIPTIMAQGVFGFLPVEMDGFFDDNGEINIGRGIAQLASGIIPQAATIVYELWAEENLYTGQDLSNYEWYNKLLNAATNFLGSGFGAAVNSIAAICGAPSDLLVGKSYAETLARNLFGIGFNNAKQQFMEMVGKEASVDANGKETAATGLFAENEKLQTQIATINKQMAYASDEEKEELGKKKQELTDAFTNRVKNLTENYMKLFSITGGLETWQKKKIVNILNLGKYYSSAEDSSYQSNDTETAALDEYALARQRYVNTGLPAGADLSSLVKNNNGNLTNSLELQAAVDRYYGVKKQASADFESSLENTNLKEIRAKFYDAIQKVYDIADRDNTTPDYDLIEKIQARYLQAFDATLIPIIQKYGVSILNNNDFINGVREYVNGMIPSDDWRQSVRNAKKFLSTKDFPTATVDVKKWLTERYTSSMKNRNLSSDEEVITRLEEIKNDIDKGLNGQAKGKIESLKKGIDKANFYISADDLRTLNKYYNMVK